MVKIINSEHAPAAIGPYVQAVDLNQLVFVSGQIPIDVKTGLMPQDVSEQAKQSLANIKAILAAADLTPANIVKTTVFLADLNDFAAVNAVYEQFFIDNHATFPARSCVQVARIPKDAKVEIEVIASRNK
ncbi:RidA family protein [Frischella perrara]|uniref:Reactive intermediate/imine deaminase n=1 Tax=Frischella perrara TaxID=1267021 RepID=A0A318MTP4_FRIPE|nr:RidA family protein [Frischella perrara]PXY96626.1 reactive intermediate/imine deaminase [Frischella perrara]